MNMVHTYNKCTQKGESALYRSLDLVYVLEVIM
jgi:hypothetical protein